MPSSFIEGSAWADLFQVLARPLVLPPGLSRYPWVQVQLAARCSKARKVRNFPSHATEGNARLTMWGKPLILERKTKHMSLERNLGARIILKTMILETCRWVYMPETVANPLPCVPETEIESTGISRLYAKSSHISLGACAPF